MITQNEEESIARCLQSVPLADEIVVVDSQSSDRTVEICKALGARVIETDDWPGFGPQKARALAAASGEWILSLDADEWIEKPLLEVLRAAISDANPADGYEIPRRSRFCGKIVKYSWGSDYVLRLFRRKRGRFSDDKVHERIIVEGRVERLGFPIEHDTIVDLADAADKIDRYSEAAAIALAKAGCRSSHFSAVARSLYAFMRTLILRAGFLDGRTGWLIAEYNRRYTYKKWIRVARLTGKI